MAYKAIVKQACKIDYETGNYTQAEIAKKRGVSPRAIEGWVEKEKWIKGGLAPIVETNMRNAMVKALVDAGVNPDKIAGTISSLLDAERTAITPSNQADKEGNKEPGFAEVVPDYVARDKGVTQAAKIAGLYAPERLEISAVMEIHQKVLAVITDMRDALPEDKREEFKRRVEACLTT